MGTPNAADLVSTHAWVHQTGVLLCPPVGQCWSAPGHCLITFWPLHLMISWPHEWHLTFSVAPNFLLISDLNLLFNPVHACTQAYIENCFFAKHFNQNTLIVDVLFDFLKPCDFRVWIIWFARMFVNVVLLFTNGGHLFTPPLNDLYCFSWFNPPPLIWYKVLSPLSDLLSPLKSGHQSTIKMIR